MQQDPYSLDRLHDIADVAPVGWWPAAPFWYWVLAVLAVWVAYSTVRLVGRWRKNAYRRLALAELQVLQTQASVETNATMIAVSQLLKRVALVAYPRQRVAPLSGQEWLEFLDKTASTSPSFVTEPVCRLGSASVQTVDCSSDEIKVVIDVAQSWIKHHHQERR